jgi:hypothetical protein
VQADEQLLLLEDDALVNIELLSGGPPIDWWDAELGVTIATDASISTPKAFNSWVTTNVTVNADATSDPDGGTEADEIVEAAAASALHAVSKAVTLYSPGTTYRYTVDLKDVDIGWVSLAFNNFGDTVWFDLANGVVGTEDGGTGTITALADDWYRCSVTFTLTLSTVYVAGARADGQASYTVTGGDERSFYAHNARLETISDPAVSAWAGQMGVVSLAPSTAIEQPEWETSVGGGPGVHTVRFRTAASNSGDNLLATGLASTSQSYTFVFGMRNDLSSAGVSHSLFDSQTGRLVIGKRLDTAAIFDGAWKVFSGVVESLGTQTRIYTLDAATGVGQYWEDGAHIEPDSAGYLGKDISGATGFGDVGLGVICPTVGIWRMAIFDRVLSDDEIALAHRWANKQ